MSSLFSEAPKDETQDANSPSAEDQRGVIEQRPLSSLKVDPLVQRGMNWNWVHRTSARFDYKSFGTPVVSARANGVLVVLDGQHRIEARKEYNASVFPDGEFADEMIDVEVFYGFSPQQEAEIFLGRNNNRQVSALEKFLVRVTAGDPDAVAIATVLEKYGWKVANGNAEGVVQAASAMERAHARNPWAFEQAFATLTAAWGHEGEAADGRIIGGLSHFWDFHTTKAEFDGLVAKLRASGTPASLIGRSKAAQEVMGCSPARALAYELTVLYNKHRRFNVLETIPTGKIS